LDRHFLKWDRKKHGEVIPIDAVEGKVLAEHIQPVLLHKAIRCVEVGFIQLPYRSDREAEPMGNAWEIGERIVEKALIRIGVGASFSHDIVLGRNFEKVDFGTVCNSFRVNIEAVGESDSVGMLVLVHRKRGIRIPGSQQGWVIDLTLLSGEVKYAGFLSLSGKRGKKNPRIAGEGLSHPSGNRRLLHEGTFIPFDQRQWLRQQLRRQWLQK
jgi:hypothetical protein